jgi:hypothetical protein
VEIASKMHSIQSFFINSYWFFLFCLFVSGDDYRQDYCNVDRKDQNHFTWSMDMIMDIISSRDGEESGATVLLTLLIQNLSFQKGMIASSTVQIARKMYVIQSLDPTRGGPCSCLIDSRILLL